MLDTRDADGDADVAYGDHTYRRLADVKAKYDPDNAVHDHHRGRGGGPAH